MAFVLPGWSSLTALAFTADGRKLVAGNYEAFAVFDVTTGRKIRNLDGKGHNARQLVMLEDGRVLGLPYSHWGLARWDLATGRYEGSLEARAGFAAAFALTRDGRTIWVAGGRTLEAFDVESNTLFDPKRRCPIAKVVALTGRGSELKGIGVGPSGVLLFWSDKSWGLSDGRSITATYQQPVRAGGFLDERSGFLVTGDELFPFALAKGSRTSLGKPIALGAPGNYACASPDGKRLFVVTKAALITFSWNGSTLAQNRSLPIEGVVGVACSADGSRVALARNEKQRTVIEIVDAARARVTSSAPPPEKIRVERSRKLSRNPPLWGVPEEQWSANNHVDFREYVANEHLLTKMPMVELHRNHGIPLAIVRRWVSLVRDGGRAALTADVRSGSKR